MAENRALKILLKGGGEQASGVAYRLFKAGFQVAISEIEKPTMVRRTVSFGNCMYEKVHTVEDVKSVRVETWSKFQETIENDKIAVFSVDYWEEFKNEFSPTVIIDGRMLKEKNDTTRDEAPVVIGIGPGFTAGTDVDAVIESNRGHYLGRTIYQGSTMPYTGIPGEVQGYQKERVLYAPFQGIFKSEKKIGDYIEKGERFGKINDEIIRAKISGIIRGQIKPGLKVKKGVKIGDIDPRKNRDHCYNISEKALAIGGGVLEGVLHLT